MERARSFAVKQTRQWKNKLENVLWLDVGRFILAAVVVMLYYYESIFLSLANNATGETINYEKITRK